MPTLWDVSALTDDECQHAFDSLATENRTWARLRLGFHDPRWCGDDGDCVHAHAGHAVLRRAVRLRAEEAS
jgi:hypothetical protein